MMLDDLDRALREPAIAPSHGFVGSVMDAVRREAATPAPISFPWSRALPGFVATALAVAACIVLLVAGGLAQHAKTSRAAASVVAWATCEESARRSTSSP